MSWSSLIVSDVKAKAAATAKEAAAIDLSNNLFGGTIEVNPDRVSHRHRLELPVRTRADHP